MVEMKTLATALLVILGIWAGALEIQQNHDSGVVYYSRPQ
jgi:hypothetical protein